MKVFKTDYTSSNETELMATILSIYSLTALKKPLPRREIEVIREYMLHGYSIKTKKAIRIGLRIKDSNLNTINYKLQKKGLLLPHPQNQKLKILNKDLTDLREVFLNSKKKCYLINVI